MLKNGGTLHFINRVDASNCGDMVVCPLLHYYDYFKQYNIKRHDMRFIDFDSIAPSDVVIIGGGGMFDYAEFTNRAINRVLNTGAAVIAWSPGFNTHTEYGVTFATKIDFNRFALVAVRDYDNRYDLEYLPDVTCKLPGLKRDYPIRRKFGIAQHKDYPIKGFNYDFIKNDRGIDEILQFIGESEIVLSNSFHMINWAMLMGKKTICVNPFSDKFYAYKHKPMYFHDGMDNFENCVENAPTYHILEESIDANDTFFERVKRIVESRLDPAENPFSLYDSLTSEALLRESIREEHLQKGDLVAPQLFIDTGTGFTEACKHIVINNVYGDDILTARYDISDYSEIKALRFDPIECHDCEVEILSAQTADGNAFMDAQLAFKVDGFDHFFTMDPQYLITPPVADFLDITFRIQVLDHFQAERAVCIHAQQLSMQIDGQNKFIAQQSEQIGHQDAQIRRQAEQIDGQNKFIAQQSEQIGHQDAQTRQQAERIEGQEKLLAQKSEQIAQQDAQIRQQAERIEGQEKLLAQKSEQIAQLDAQIRQQAELIQEVYISTCWKITAPIRVVLDFIKHLWKGKQ